MEEREEELKKFFMSELENVKKAQKTIVSEKISHLDNALKNHQQEFMMVQQMNDANSMQHEEARRQAMKTVKVRFYEKLLSNNFFVFKYLSKKAVSLI